jgi:hypothetical protein
MKLFSSRLVTLFITSCLSVVSSFATTDSLHYQFEQTTTASSGFFAPFWMQSQHFGTIPQHAYSNMLRASVEKRMSKDTPLDFAYGIDGIVNTSNSAPIHAWIHQFYLQARWLIFDLTLGAKEYDQLLTDRYLSSGALIFSPNARPMPRITAGIENFTSVPLTNNQVQFRGGLTHAWFSDNTYVPDIWMHHKYLHLRFGARLPVRIQVGLDHMAQWGGQLPDYPPQQFNYTTFKSIFFAKAGGDAHSVFEQYNSLGNHIVSEHIRLEADIDGFTTHLYWQNILEDGPIRVAPWKLMNRKDGMWGISIENNRLPAIQKIVYEFVNTTDQSGYTHDKDGIVYGGKDSYLTNGTYMNDWAFHLRTIGTPLILSPVFNTDGSFRIKHHHLRAHHIGIQGRHDEWSYRMLTTHLRHYDYHLRLISANLSWMVQLARTIGKKQPLELEMSLGSDRSTIPGTTTGIQLTIRKNGILFQP